MSDSDARAVLSRIAVDDDECDSSFDEVVMGAFLPMTPPRRQRTTQEARSRARRRHRSHTRERVCRTLDADLNDGALSALGMEIRNADCGMRGVYWGLTNLGMSGAALPCRPLDVSACA